MSHRIEIVAQKFGLLTVLEEDGYIGKHLAYKCKCECGNTKTVQGNSLRSGNTGSCGCRKKVDLTNYETKHCKVLSQTRTGYWNIKCKHCGKVHEQHAREIRKESWPRKCEKFKAHNWSGLDREDAIVRRKYGISLDQYADLIEKQGGGCAICGRNKEPDGRRLSIDHDHETGLTRGVLCYACNKALGLFYDKKDLLLNAHTYLVNPPAKTYLGIE